MQSVSSLFYLLSHMSNPFIRTSLSMTHGLFQSCNQTYVGKHLGHKLVLSCNRPNLILLTSDIDSLVGGARMLARKTEHSTEQMSSKLAKLPVFSMVQTLQLSLLYHRTYFQLTVMSHNWSQRKHHHEFHHRYICESYSLYCRDCRAFGEKCYHPSCCYGGLPVTVISVLEVSFCVAKHSPELEANEFICLQQRRHMIVLRQCYCKYFFLQQFRYFMRHQMFQSKFLVLCLISMTLCMTRVKVAHFVDFSMRSSKGL